MNCWSGCFSSMGRIHQKEGVAYRVQSCMMTWEDANDDTYSCCLCNGKWQFSSSKPRPLLATRKPIDALYFSAPKPECTHLHAISKSSPKFFNINSLLSNNALQISQDLPNNYCRAVKQIMVKDHNLKETYCKEHHRALEKPFCNRGVSRIDRKSK